MGSAIAAFCRYNGRESNLVSLQISKVTDMSTNPADGSSFDQGGDAPAPADDPGQNALPADVSGAGTPTAAERMREAKQQRTGDDDEPEEDLWAGGYSSKAMFGNWMLAAFVTVLLLIVVIMTRPGSAGFWLAWIVLSGLLWAYFAMLLAYRRMTVKYNLTSQRFIHESGLLKRTTDRIEVIDIDDVALEQRLIERFVGVGTIKITSSDRSHPELQLRGIEDVKNVSTLIDDTRRKERLKRSVHIEAI